MLNKVMVIGHLGRDPEMRYTANGSAVTTFSVASGRRYTSNGEQREETEWFNVVAWNRLAENCAQYLQKGRLVYVEGRQQTRSWDDAQTGAKRYRTELIAETVQFLGGNGERAGVFTPGIAFDDGDDIDPDDLPF